MFAVTLRLGSDRAVAEHSRTAPSSAELALRRSWVVERGPVEDCKRGGGRGEG